MSKSWDDLKNEIKRMIKWQDFYRDVKNIKTSTADWMKGNCPLHNDTTASFTFHSKHLGWMCHAGCGQGDIFDFLEKKDGLDFKAAINMLADTYHLEKPNNNPTPEIPELLIEKYTEALLRTNHIKTILTEQRGLSIDTIKAFGLGWSSKRKRITIPIRDDKGKLVNIRYYLPNAGKKDIKIQSHTIEVNDKKIGYGNMRLYGVDKLIIYKGSQVIICEGELDRILLEQYGFMAVTGTAGCNGFNREWTQYFKNKDVILLFDCDQAGMRAINQTIIPKFKNTEIKSIRNVKLPLNGTKDEKDITDYFIKAQFGKEHLINLINTTKTHNYIKKIKQEEIIKLDSFIEIEQDIYKNKKVECDIVIDGETEESFHAVTEFKVIYCKLLDQDKCSDCMENIQIPLGSEEFIYSCMSDDSKVLGRLRDYCCRYGQKPTIEKLKSRTIKEFFCHQVINRITERSDDDTSQTTNGKVEEFLEKKVYYISHERPKVGIYKAIGWVKTHPKTQAITFLIETLTPQEDDYQAFRVDDNIELLNEIKKYPGSKMVKDLTNHVTGIYERDELIYACLLTYFSPLWFIFNSEKTRGWINTAIIGDVGTGKTQTFTRIADFINVGDVISGLTSSRTGALYAITNSPTKGWKITIGRYPANDGKLLLIDEAQHFDPEEMKQIGKAMDEGCLHVSRVVDQVYDTRTRLLLICNPVKQRNMDGYAFGCTVLPELFNSAFIRRLDLAIIVNSNDIESDKYINQLKPNKKEQKITAEMLRALVYWAWNLKIKQINFTDQATNLCLTKAEELSEIYSYASDVPLVLKADYRKNIARLAVGFAVMNINTQDFNELIITEEHIIMAVEFVKIIYSNSNCQLDEYSDIQKMSEQLKDYNNIESIFINKKSKDNDSLFFSVIISLLKTQDCIKRNVLQEQVDCSDWDLRGVLSVLKKFNLINSSRNGLIRTSKFTKFIKIFKIENSEFWKKELEKYYNNNVVIEENMPF